MNTTRLLTLTLAIAGACLSSARAQTTAAHPVVGGLYDEEKHHVELSDAAWRVGFGVGPSIGTEAKLIADFRMQERLFARRQFNDLVQAELGLGVHRIAGNHLDADEYDTQFWSLDARALVAPALDDQWNPYAFAGMGYAIWRIIDPADETVRSEADVAVGDNGGGIIVPLGLGVQFKPDRHSRIAIDMNVGYSMILSDEVDGAAGGANASAFTGLLSLEYLFHDVATPAAQTVAAQ